MPTDAATLDLLCVNTIRGLSMDGVQKANSGHPGLPMGAAAFAYALWSRHLKHSPKNPHWFDRDRFVLSAGHGSMLIYSLLHLTGYDLTLEDLQNFRQLNSRTPGHPEYHHTAGVEVTTGPLGQGFAHAVGMAIAEKWFAATYNKPGHEIIDHHTYVLCSDGDLMEGVTYEASSLAGHLGLGKLVVLYDDNDISLDGPTSLSFSEDVVKRFEAIGWDAVRVDGMDIDAVDAAISAAKLITDKPSIICCKTIIGFGSPHKQGTQKSHGSPLGLDEVKLTKEALGIPLEPTFYVPEEASAKFLEAVSNGIASEASWTTRFAAYAEAFPKEAEELQKLINSDFGTAWVDALPSFSADKSQATREVSRDVIQAIAAHHKGLIGGNADLSESTFALQKSSGDFSRENPSARNIFYGVREHAMMAATSGLVLHGGLRAFGGTFFNFVDYCKPSIRLAALMGIPTIAVFTHDSIGLGEDGPTHQPVEQLTGLRATPNLNVIRPADGNETAVAWKMALESSDHPTALILTRQKVANVTPEDVQDHPSERGGYVLIDTESEPDVVLIGTGSELGLAISAAKILGEKGIAARVVSMPSVFTFERQEPAYCESVLPPAIPAVAVEAGATMGWFKYADAVIGIDRFGMSAPADQIYKALGVTAESIVQTVEYLL